MLKYKIPQIVTLTPYLFIAPVEISLITFAPVAFLNGYGLVFTGICLAAGLAVLATAYIKGWFIRKQ